MSAVPDHSADSRVVEEDVVAGTVMAVAAGTAVAGHMAAAIETGAVVAADTCHTQLVPVSRVPLQLIPVLVSRLSAVLRLPL